jgi:hypothetical protein
VASCRIVEVPCDHRLTLHETDNLQISDNPGLERIIDSYLRN